jgi:hypothetical protein
MISNQERRLESRRGRPEAGSTVAATGSQCVCGKAALCYRLCENISNHFPGYIGQAEIPAGVAEGEFLVIDAQQVQDSGVQIVN